MKTLKFRAHLKAPILKGEKTTTWRLFDDKNLSVDDELLFMVSETGEHFAVAKIVSVRETTMDKLTKDDWAGHEVYTSEEDIYQQYEAYYKRPVDEKSPIKIIKFKLLKKLS
ncbi:MAG: ASCH domain-containing protein [Candidatus Aenigmarchaeota archaeon]|nr:ASCH domain-containing protein [Candidatus Aenigmarchaeota archaeon]